MEIKTYNCTSFKNDNNDIRGPIVKAERSENISHKVTLRNLI